MSTSARRGLGVATSSLSYDGGHVFTPPMRERAYAFLEEALGQ